MGCMMRQRVLPHCLQQVQVTYHSATVRVSCAAGSRTIPFSLDVVQFQ